METEFVNVYITKLKAMIDDLVGKVLILETRIVLYEKELIATNQMVEQTQKELADAQQKTRVQKKEIKAESF
jgi:hypothetical protein